METGRKNITARVAVLGSLIVLIILIFGTIYTARSARKDTEEAVRTVSLLYLDELAGRRESVVENNLQNRILELNTAIGLMDEDDLSDEAHLQAYQARMRKLYTLSKFAFIDSDGLMYTAEGTRTDTDDYKIDYMHLTEPSISIFNLDTPEKMVIIAVPVDLSLEGKQLKACFMEIDMQEMLAGASISSTSGEATFCNIYTKDGIPLTNTVLGGLAVEANLLDAMTHADFEAGYSYDGFLTAFQEQQKGAVSFTYNGIRETLSYVPVSGTDWLLTYLIRESVITEKISPITYGIISRSVLQSLLTILALLAMFGYIIHQGRRNTQERLAHETAEAASRAKQEEMDHTASEKRIAEEAAKAAAAAAAAGAGSDGAALAEAFSGGTEGAAADDAGQGSDADERILQARMNQLREEEKAREAQEQLKAEQEQAAAKAALPSYIRDIPEHSGSIQLKTASIFSVILALLAAFALLAADAGVTRAYKRMKQASDDYVASQLAAADMETGSDFLTDSVRCFVVTGDREYLNDFTEEVEFTKRRDKAVENLEELLADSESSALVSLHTALDLSNELVDIENKAMRLMVEAGDYDPGTIPDSVMAVELSPEELALPPEEQQKLAQSLVFDNDYKHYKARIRENVDACTRELIRASTTELDQASAQLSLLANLQTTMTILFLLIVLFIVLIISQMIRKPLSTMVQKMQKQEMIPPTGVDELRYVTQIYNSILRENQEARERLSHEASHDALTGLFNRGAYDLLMESADTEHMALLLIDVDHFKTVNDTYGHAIGDRVLKRVADILRHSFRSVDILCRIGGDEFAVVMTRVNSSMKQLVINKIAQANNILQHPTDDLPPVSLSVGVAFSDRENPQGDIFRDADAALYKVKEAGRKGCAVFE